MDKSKIARVFGKKHNILIGMIHLPPLMSVAGFPGMDRSVAKALADLRALEVAGFDGALIENDDDKPHTEFANNAQVASFTAIANEVCQKAKIPIGVQMMLNDWQASLAIAKAVGASFTRLDVFVDHVTCEWGEINPDPRKIVAYKEKICPGVLLLTDLQVKYKKMVKSRSLSDSAALAIKSGSDGLIVTGEATGKETPIEKVVEVKKRFPDFPVFIGAGINTKNIRDQFKIADGAIVGTSIKNGNKISYHKARLLKSRLL
ncbi:MAG: BtpA/SgcQ family protein [Candidatus Vogelbacteria bacterium]|nr:BtpA/SgcQ family protein [Candidatus Vogelbacteria bacterium]